MALTACQTEGEGPQRAAAARLSRAIEVLREADNARKVAPLEDLQKLECPSDDLCELKERCVAAYRLHVKALDTLAAVRGATRKSADPLGDRAVRGIEEATAQLERAQEGAKQCADLQGRIVRKYDL